MQVFDSKMDVTNGSFTEWEVQGLLDRRFALKKLPGCACMDETQGEAFEHGTVYGSINGSDLVLNTSPYEIGYNQTVEIEPNDDDDVASNMH